MNTKLKTRLTVHWNLIAVTQPIEVLPRYDDLISLIKQFRQDLSNHSVSTDYKVLTQRIKSVGNRLKDTILKSSVAPSEFIVANFFAACLMQAMAAGRICDGIIASGINASAQVLVFDSRRERILLQRRGTYKRLFPNKFTVSANAKVRDGKEDICELIRDAVRKEIGLYLPWNRFKELLPDKQRYGRLINFDFLAMDSNEADMLRTCSNELNKRSDLWPIQVEFNEEKRTLCLYTVDLNTELSSIQAIINQIEDETRIPAINQVNIKTNHKLFIIQLNAEEEAKIVVSEDKLIDSVKSEMDLLKLDSDSMQFKHWMEVATMFQRTPKAFAQDLIYPHFSDPEFWHAIAPNVIEVEHPSASLVSIAGGKGANTQILRRAMRDSVISGLQVPDSSIVTTYCFSRLILGDDAIRKQVEHLELSTEEAEEKQCKCLQEQIKKQDLPQDLKNELDAEFIRLGRDIAVRSSATVEDLEEYAAAGQAITHLHVINESQLYDAVKDVWASLYLKGFLENRRSLNKTQLPQMAVLLQRFIAPEAAGVIFSIHPSTNRPVFSIEAQPGVGEGVVQGEGASDLWLVGLRADILECAIRTKTKRYCIDEKGGTKAEYCNIIEPCMTDEQVLHLAKIAAGLLGYYRQNKFAKEVDIEFVLDKNGFFHIVQARSKITVETRTINGKPVLPIRVVDVANLAQPEEFVYLDKALVANPGAVTAPLQVIKGDEELGPNIAIPGAIIVTHHTNNSWNDVFAKISAVITTDGGMTSHAAQNSQALKIPCIVGAINSMQELQQFDGKLVTLDAENKRVYLGQRPIIEINLPLDVWVETAEQAEIFMNSREEHEIFRPWLVSKQKRPEVFIEDFEGIWRRRSASYGLFELDYYYQAWDQLTVYFNNKFSNRKPWTLEPLHREIKVTEGPKCMSLFQEVIVNDTKGVFAFINGIKDFNLSDAQGLFDDRWKGLQEFGIFMDSINAITSDNVEQVVNAVIKGFVWMHFGFWVDAIVEEKFVAPQLQYINSELHNLLRNESVRTLCHMESIAPGRTDVRLGKVIFLSRAKDRSIYEVLEKIRESASLLACFNFNTPEGIEEALQKANPELLEEINGWSWKYKRTSEELRDISDTYGYLTDLRDRILHGSTLSNKELLAQFLLDYFDSNNTSSRSIENIQANAPNFWFLLRGFTRNLFHQSSIASWDDLKTTERGLYLLTVSAEDIDSTLPKAFEDLMQTVNLHEQFRGSIAFVLRDDLFPNLKKTLALSKMQFLLREDGHHLVVPWQRKLAQMMRECAKTKLKVLDAEDDVFNISTDELVALVIENNPMYIKKTFERWQILRQAEFLMKETWLSDPKEALAQFSRAIADACIILDFQSKATTTGRTRDSYLKEQERLQNRLKRLESRLV